jgi:hypothetical protein
MLLSSLLTVTPYLEYGWVCTPSTAGQSISANTVTTLTITTEVADSGNFGSVASNQVTLASGTYIFEAYTHYRMTSNSPCGGILALYNVTDSAFVSRNSTTGGAGASASGESIKFDGQFTISATKVFELRLLTTAAATVDSGQATAVFTDATSNFDQRTTLKLFKMA